MLKLQRWVVLVTVVMVSSKGFCGVSLSDGAKDWLHSQFSDGLAVSFSKDKIAFKGCKQKSYQVDFTQTFETGMRLQGSLLYDKGSMSHGHLVQRVSTHAFQVASWWDYDDFSVGLSAMQQSRHQISLPFTQPINLPRSQTLGVHLQMPGFYDAHEWELIATHNKWTADQSEIALPWTNSYNNQLEVSYRIAF